MEELVGGLGEAAAPSEPPEIAPAAKPAGFDLGGDEQSAAEPPLPERDHSNPDQEAETDRWELDDGSGLDLDKGLADTVCQLPEPDSLPQPPGAAELDLQPAPPDAEPLPKAVPPAAEDPASDATQLFVPPPASLEADRTQLLSPDQLPSPEAPEAEPAGSSDATVLQLDVGDPEADIDSLEPLDPDEKDE